ncbi:hypothetical protein QYE76_015502 [Lolium multiflorum]|uniref:GRF-type domain-containing protein n=1 Tax=Lolium multiflorum TaxID=4521 RepID=A0AAD8U707_LOLMU|nr:hypothetical protein QYE76_015502 [Lolium multiflorum]
MEMPILLCPRCRAPVDWRISRTPKNTNRPFYVCSSEKGIKCFFVWVDVLLQTLMNQLLDEHEEWLPILPQTTRVDREVAFELRWMNQKIRELEDQSTIWNYICAFVGGIVISLV